MQSPTAIVRPLNHCQAPQPFSGSSTFVRPLNHCQAPQSLSFSSTIVRPLNYCQAPQPMSRSYLIIFWVPPYRSHAMKKSHTFSGMILMISSTILDNTAVTRRRFRVRSVFSRLNSRRRCQPRLSSASVHAPPPASSVQTPFSPSSCEAPSPFAPLCGPSVGSSTT